jgi:hypothetical protein
MASIKGKCIKEDGVCKLNNAVVLSARYSFLAALVVAISFAFSISTRIDFYIGQLLFQLTPR